MKVLVIGMNGRGLSPTTPRKARILVKEGRAVVVRKVPYTIKLLYKTGVAGQKLTLGVDTGSQHIGIGVTNDKKAIIKAEFSLRPSMEKRQLMETRTSYRRGRRYRKIRYRRSKFRHHAKRSYSEKADKRHGHLTHWVKETPCFSSNRKEGWLPPSIESKVRHHLCIIERYLRALPDGTRLRIEAARFDVARMKDPQIHGELYQGSVIIHD